MPGKVGRFGWTYSAAQPSRTPWRQEIGEREGLDHEVLGRQGCYYWSVETHVSPGQASLPELGVSIVGTAPPPTKQHFDGGASRRVYHLSNVDLCLFLNPLIFFLCLYLIIAK